MNQKANAAFTLIELLVVVLIIGILSAVAVPQYQIATAKARLVRLFPVFDTILQAQQMYIMEHGEGTADISLLDIDVPFTATPTKNPESFSRQYLIDTNSHVHFYQTGHMAAFGHRKLNFSVDYFRPGYSPFYKGICYTTSNSATLGTKICKSLGVKREVPREGGGTIWYF